MIPTEAPRGRVVLASTAAGGVSTGGAFALMFVTLKLCHVIGWPWWQVLAPFWIPAAAAGLLIAGFAIAYAIASYVDVRERARQARARAGGVRPGEHGPAARWRR